MSKLQRLMSNPWRNEPPTWRDRLTDWALALLMRLNPNKDRALAWRLHRLADLYNPSPTGQWEPEERP